MKDNNSLSAGVSFTGLLTILFIALKLLGVIDWPWVWVISPLWISLTVGLIILGLVFIAAIFESKK